MQPHPLVASRARSGRAASRRQGGQPSRGPGCVTQTRSIREHGGVPVPQASRTGGPGLSTFRTSPKSLALPCPAQPGLTRPSPTLPCPALPRPAGRGSSPHPPLGAQHLHRPAGAGPRLTMAASAPTARSHTAPATPVVLVTPARRPAPASRWARRWPLARIHHVICRRALRPAHFFWPHAALRRGLGVSGLHTWSVPSWQHHLDAPQPTGDPAMHCP